MQKTLVSILTALLLLWATGCSFLHREYSSVNPHSSTYYDGADKNVLRAENYQDLVNDLLILIERRAETGTIHLYTHVEELNAEETMAAAALETQYETPLGAYAVEFITYTVGGEVSGATVLEVEFGYRRTAGQMESILHATGVSALSTLLPAALDNGAAELVLQVGYFNSRIELDEVVNTVRSSRGITAPWQVICYPNDTDAGIVEIVFDPEEPVSGEQTE